MPLAIRAIAALVLLALAPSAAEAATLVTPTFNSSVSSTPTFTWRLAPGEQSFSLELSPNPAPGDNGGFADDTEKRQALLQDRQTSYTVGSRDPLTPGTWFWHVSATDPDFTSRWSTLGRIVVRDERITLESFKFTNFSCTRQMSVDFTYSDNSAGQPATYRVEFRRSRRGRRVASVAGRADAGRLFRTFRRPRALRRGKRYFAQLKIRDAGRHVDRSGLRRFRVRGC